MNYGKKNLIFYVLFLLVGICCIIYTILQETSGKSVNGIIIGLSSGFGVTGILGIISSVKLIRNPKKAEEIEIYKNEERNVFIREKTNSSVYTVCLYIECLAVIITGILGYKIITMTIASLILLKMILWIIIGNHYWKKY